MAKSSDKIIKDLKVYLGMESREASLELTDQTVFAAKFSEGESVYFKKEEDQVPLPKGVYTTKDGKQLLSVDEKGAFVSLEEAPMEEEKAAEEKSDNKEYLTKEDAEAAFVSKEDFLALLEVVKEISDNNVEMSAENKSLKKELSKVEEELATTKQLLSKVETPKVTHSPEPTPTKSEGLSGAAIPLSAIQRNIFRQFNA